MFILPKIPSFGERLAQSLTGGLGKGLDTASSLIEQTMKQRAKRGPTLAETLGEYQKSLGKKPSSNNLIMRDEGDKDADISDDNIFGSPEFLQYLALNNPDALQSFQDLEKSNLDIQKKRQDIREESSQKEGLEDSLNRLDELADEYSYDWTDFGLSTSIPGTKWYEGARELDTLGLWAADSAYTHFNKGALAQTKWEDIKDKLSPQAGLTKRENKARIRAMRQILKLPSNSSSQKIDKALDAQLKYVEKNTRPPLDSFYE